LQIPPHTEDSRGNFFLIKKAPDLRKIYPRGKNNMLTPAATKAAECYVCKKHTKGGDSRCGCGGRNDDERHLLEILRILTIPSGPAQPVINVVPKPGEKFIPDFHEHLIVIRGYFMKVFSGLPENTTIARFAACGYVIPCNG